MDSENKQLRLSSIRLEMNQLEEKEESSRYAVELNLKTREYSFLSQNSLKLETIQIKMNNLSIEAKTLIDEIEKENLELLL